MTRQASITTVLTLILTLAPAGQTARAYDDPCAAIFGDPTAPASLRLACHRTVPFSDAVRHNVLDGIEDNLRNWVASTPAYLAGAVPGGEPLDVFTELTGPGSFLRTHMFESDYDFQIAVVNELLARLRNRHNFYLPDICYNHFYWNPVTLSSTTRFGGEQIVFVDLLDVPLPGLFGMTLAAFYRDVLAGPDVTPYDGLKVVSINGVPAVEAVRAQGDRLDHSANPSNRFNLALRTINFRGLGSVAVPVPSPSRFYLPLDDDAADMIYVFADRAGRQFGPVSIPLRPAGVFGSPTAEDFQQACETFHPSVPRFDLVDQPQPASGARTDDARASLLAAWKGVSPPMTASASAGLLKGLPGGRFFDMPPGAPGFGTRLVPELVYPYDGTAVRTYLVTDDDGDAGVVAVAIELPSFDSDPSWLLGVGAGVSLACETDADHLILDLRQNTGGNTTAKNLLTFLLFEPDQTRIADRDPTLHPEHAQPEQFRRTPYSVSLFWQSYAASQYPFGIPPAILLGDFLDLQGNPLTPAFYDSVEQVDFGNGVFAEYTARVFLNTWALTPDFELPLNPCPGRFQGERLIVLGDGTALSAGPFWVMGARDRVTVVTTGGDAEIDVPPSMGHELGGTTLLWGAGGIAQLHQILVEAAWAGLPVMPALPLQRAPFLREVQMRFEQTQFYEGPDSDVLTRSREVEPDATIDTWIYNRVRGEELDRYAYVYTKAILAARKLHD